MGKPVHGHSDTSHARSIILPVLTLGFYGLHRFRPRWLYNLTALSFLALWVAIAFVAGSIQNGGEYLTAPLVFVMAGITFFRLMPPATRRLAPGR
jgi:hypothetical protein